MTGLPTPADHVLAQFPGMGPKAGRLLRLGEQWKCWVLCDRDPVYGWTDGRVALTGDAGDFPQRLVDHNRARAPRTARAQQVARAMGREVYHPAGVAAKERNAEIGSLSEAELYGKVAWLHDGTP
ncbi:hypothetical protein [Streptomyces sp. NBC_01618]|uniref:hypothetical protein n=1 Tax=Streptomyces sp. NBC_01618 TaxID=2975900 RepID=UPI00386ED4FB|nr:hypothetical protein OH735_01250 [Streptomyces sp. NBC_01618]